jgi:hypothetical protein
MSVTSLISALPIPRDYFSFFSPLVGFTALSSVSSDRLASRDTDAMPLLWRL